MTFKKIYPFIVFLLFPLILNGKYLEIKGLDKLSFEDLQALTTIDLNNTNLSNSDLNLIIQEIYDQNLIFELNVTELESKFILTLEENNLIQNIFFNKNSWVEDQILLESIKSKKGSYISKSDISKDIETINMIYKSKGFYNVSVAVKIETFSQDRVNLIYEINEGKRYKLNL